MSESTEDIRVGDKVRVTYMYEGEVKGNSSGGMYIQTSMDGQVVFGTGYEGETVELLERALPKVGDVVRGSELDRLPDLSVVHLSTPHNPKALRVKLNGTWTDPRDDLRFDGESMEFFDYRVLHIPE